MSFHGGAWIGRSSPADGIEEWITSGGGGSGSAVAVAVSVHSPRPSGADKTMSPTEGN